MAAPVRIGWIVQSRSFDIASVRYRCHYPAYALGLSGHSSQIFDDPAKATAALPDLDVLIILKRLDHAMIPLAARARERRVSVILDLCDDIFSPGYRGDVPDMNVMVLAALATAADLIVTTGDALSERVRNALPLWTPVVEIPDVNETPELMAAARAHFDIAPPPPPSPLAPREESGWARAVRRLRFAAGHPVEAVRRTRLRVQRHPLSIQAHQQVGRLVYILRHPDWAASRAARAWRRTPLRAKLVQTSGRLWFRLRNPANTARKLQHAVLSSGPGVALRKGAGRTIYIVRHPGWLAARVVRAPAVVRLRTGLGRLRYAAARPRWAGRKLLHHTLTSRPGVVARTWIARTAYGVKRPGWAARRSVHALGRLSATPAMVRVRTAFGRAVWLAKRPDRALAKGLHSGHKLMAAGFRLRRRWFGARRDQPLAIPTESLPLRLDAVGSLELVRPPPAEAAPAPAEAVREEPAPAAPSPPRLPRVVWFGNHGGPHSNFGMLSVLAAVKALRQAHAVHPFELVLISSDRAKFNAFFLRIGLNVRYVEWTAEAVHRELAEASVALLTTGDDRFSRVKSANRAVLALSAGVPVVASASPALEPLRDCIATDVGRGLRQYLGDPQKGADDVLRGQAIIDRLFGVDVVKAKWEGALEGVAQRARVRRARRRTQPKVSFLIDLIQDLDILLPVIDAARARGLVCNLIVSERAAAESARVVEAIVERQIIPTSLTQGALSRLDARWLRDSDVLITAAETSLPPHAAAHTLTRLANSLGLRTACIQHGYEAPGLTFALPNPPVIASQVIFTWTDAANLPACTHPDVRARAVGVGRPRPASRGPAAAPPSNPRPVVGVFENLHWERYSQEYRLRFLDELQALAHDRPDVVFQVRPHPAGLWFLRRGPAVHLENLVVIQQNLDAQPIEAVMAGLDAVITTPSTVALDACVAGKPVAVVGGDLADLGAYAPLPVLRGPEDWAAFLEALPDPECRRLGEEFLARATLGGDASERILDHVCGETWPPGSDRPHATTARDPSAASDRPPIERTVGDLATAGS